MNSVEVQEVANSFDRSITIQPKTNVGTISLVKAKPENVVRALEASSPERVQARVDLVVALDKSFRYFTLNSQQQAQLLDLCAEYRHVLPLPPRELRKCAEAGSPLQPQVEPVDRQP